MSILDWIKVKFGIYKVTEIKLSKPIIIEPGESFHYRVNINTGEVINIKEPQGSKQTKE